MRNFIKIVEDHSMSVLPPEEDQVSEQADADNMYGDAPKKQHRFGRQDGGQEFGDRGRADTYSRANNPRYADNSMTGDNPDKETSIVNEFSGDHEAAGIEPPPASQLDIIHQILTRTGLSDTEIKQGVLLTDGGKRKLAANIGVSPEEIDLLLASLIQKLRTDDDTSTDALIDDYYSGMSEGKNAPIVTRLKGKKLPFNQGVIAEGRFSYEPDALGNVTIRDKDTGKSKYIQGTEATNLLTQLDNGANQEKLIAPFLKEDVANIESNDSDDGEYMSEIESFSGTYNFPWKYNGQHGFATVQYHTDNDDPELKLESVRDENGDEIDIDDDEDMHDALIAQATEFIGNE